MSGFFYLILLVLIIGDAFIILYFQRKLSQSNSKHKQELESISLALEQKVEEATKEKNRILAIIQSMAEGVVVIDAEQKIIMMNSVLAGVLDVRKEEAQGRFFWEIVRDPSVNGMVQSCLSEKIKLKKEHTLLLSEKIFQIHIAPISSMDEFLGVVAVFHDVTKLKELERMRTEFVANVSHELKTPLTSILGFVETLKEGALNDEENRMRFLQIIEEQAYKLHRLIEDLLVLSRLESGKEELLMESADLEEMLIHALQSLDKSIKAKQIQIRMDLEPKPFFIMVDQKSFEQVLSNLLDNAIKYNKPHGHVEIRARYKNGHALIEFEDAGIGIPDQDLPRIFERFYRVDKSRSRESGGTGLGLSIVKHILERHEASITATSRLDKGTLFRISIPQH